MYTYRYPHPAVAADCVVIANDGTASWLLLIRRGNAPFKGCWAFPGGFMNIDEEASQCARRELREETGLTIDKLYQVGAYSDPDRDPRERVISIVYLALIDERITVAGDDDASEARWFPLDELPELAFDHGTILRDALKLAATLQS